jgi:CDP-diacylglycerol--glycerol-3-phosphate 3-phosphatidyltransferase
MSFSPPSYRSETAALISLRRRWAGVALLYATAWWLSYHLLHIAWHANFAERWRYLSACMALVLLTILWRGLPHNRPSEASRLWPTLGHANWLSLVRGILLFSLAGFIFLPRPTIALTWLPALLYTADRITDLFDGYLARTMGRESKLGAILDIELDGLGLLVAVILGVQYGLLPSWYLVLAVSRQLFVLGLTLRQRSGRPNRDLPPSDNRRVIAGFQTGFLTVMLWPVMLPALSHLAAYLFAVPLIYSFGRDWLVVSHVLDPASRSYQQARATIKQIVEQWLPVVARFVIGIYTGVVLWPLLRDGMAWLTFATFWELPTDAWLRYGIVAICTAAAVAVLGGIAARLGALVLLALALFHIGVFGIQWQGSGWLFVASIVVAHLGSGRFTLWQPEERWLRTQYGKPKP